MKNKRYEESRKTLVEGKAYPLEDGLKMLKSFKKAKFDESVEIHINLNTGMKKIPQNITGSVSLPAGTGKDVRVAVISKGAKAEEALAAGADKVGGEDIVAEILAGKIDFDVLLTTPDCMKDVAKVARIIGPRGLMPTPKAGTVTMEIAAAVKNYKAGLLRWKVDATGNIHALCGKISFADDKLAENIKAILESVRAAKMPFPAGNVIKKISIATTMSPGVRISA
ncbi:MAG: 50S ribosomal protein L1 [Elusimicrobia bacterium CG03_land_8_20_14_0_80_50_18]|nr:MAG: 50S ribosomal protein L1 [Elusimicrobia bacterium CG03_land_8_20_14_0_80_50_18]PIX14004.1 MAG: 50S ribosomal protein L1 [Elusimicrobia bacterium CG_4_8_14_3_um_filter_50_9]